MEAYVNLAFLRRLHEDAPKLYQQLPRPESEKKSDNLNTVVVGLTPALR